MGGGGDDNHRQHHIAQILRVAQVLGVGVNMLMEHTRMRWDAYQLVVHLVVATTVSRQSRMHDRGDGVHEHVHEGGRVDVWVSDSLLLK